MSQACVSYNGVGVGVMNRYSGGLAAFGMNHRCSETQIGEREREGGGGRGVSTLCTAAAVMFFISLLNMYSRVFIISFSIVLLTRPLSSIEIDSYTVFVFRL